MISADTSELVNGNIIWIFKLLLIQNYILHSIKIMFNFIYQTKKKSFSFIKINNIIQKNENNKTKLKFFKDKRIKK